MVYAAHHALMETNAKNNASNMVAFFDAEEETNSGKLLSFPIPSKDGGRDLNVVYNRNFHLTHSAERFIKIVKEIYTKKK